MSQSARPWRRRAQPAFLSTWWAMFVAGLLVPPVALWMLWRRGKTSGWKKTAALVPLLLLGTLHLVVFWGMRYETYGGGVPRPAFPWRDLHYRAVERRSQADQARASSPTPTPAPAAAQTGGTPAAKPAEPAAPAGAAALVFDPNAPWPGFYGRGHDGLYNQTRVNLNWPPGGLPLVWKRPVGGGYASLTVAEGKIFTIEQRREEEVAVAYDFKTGRELWVNRWQALFSEAMGGDGPRATPVYDGGRVYALGANGEFRALEAATGRTLWAKNILAENGAPNIQWGMAASPLVVDGKVIVLPGGPGNSVVAYDKLSGKKLWGALDDRAAYTAPVTAVFFGFRQLLVVTASRAVGLHVQTGELLWEFPWQTQYDVNATLPIISGHNSFILSAGYDHGSVRVGLRRSAQRLRPYLEWESKALKARFNNAVLFEDTVYGLDEGILVAMDAATGQRRWKAGRYGYGQLLLAEGHLIILTEHGELVLVRATPARHTELARFEAIDGKTWNVPAMADGHLIVRNTNEMASFKIAP